MVDVKLISCRATQALSQRISTAYGKELSDMIVLQFSDGEFQPNIQESVRGSYVFILQSTFAPSDNLMELLLTIDAAKRASAGYITAVMPYFGLARQDRKDKPRVAIGSKLVANLLTAAGADRIITMDLHADQIQGFFDIPVDHLKSNAVFRPYVENLGLTDLVFASPDTGSTKRARSYSKAFGTGLVICDKVRRKANEVAEMTVIGDVRNKNVIITDDIIDTGNSLCMAAKAMMEQGAKSVRACVTHAVLSGKAYETVENSVLTELVVTDTIPLRQSSSKIKVLSVDEIFATVIRNAHDHKSISSLFFE